MIPCKCGEPTCDYENNAAKVKDFCLEHTIEITRDANDNGTLAKPVTQGQINDMIARWANVPDYCAAATIDRGYGMRDSLGLTEVGIYTLAVDVGGGREFGVKCWVLPADHTHAVGNEARLNSRKHEVTLSQRADSFTGIPRPSEPADWGDDEFWVRTTESLVADILAHRKMLDDKIARLKMELSAAEAERGTFAERIADAADGLSYPTP